MNFLQLPRELITNISCYLPLIGIYNLSCCHGYFRTSFDIDWNKYFHYHLGLDINLNKTDLISYNRFYIRKLNYYQYLKFINDGNIWKISYEKELNPMKTELNEILTLIDNVVKEYKGTTLYERLISSTKPVLLRRTDLVDNYIGFTDIKTRKVLNTYLNKVVVIEYEELYHGGDDQFGADALCTIQEFNKSNYNTLIILY